MNVRADLREFSLPLRSPLGTADGETSSREGFLLRLEIDGAAGVGEATPLPGWTESLSGCRDALEDAIQRFRDLDEPDAMAALSDAPAARHAFSLALLDLRASHEGTPLYRYLGDGERAESVPVNATVGDGDVAETVSAAEEAVDAGFGCLKLKVGARSVSADVRRVLAVREAVGPDVDLRADANAAWTRDQAREVLTALADADLEYVEQPLPRDDLAGHADLRKSGSIPIALDETLATTPVADVLDAHAADVLVLKPMALGGVAEAYDVAARARVAGIDPVVTTTIDGVVARTAAVHLAAAIPDVRACGLATGDLLAADLGVDPAPVADGAIHVPQAPGTGATVDDESEHVCEGTAYR